MTRLALLYKMSGDQIDFDVNSYGANVIMKLELGEVTAIDACRHQDKATKNIDFYSFFQTIIRL